MKQLYIAMCVAALLAGCKPNIVPEKPTAGSADFKRFMVVGDSYSAGFADGSMYRSVQVNSFAAMLAEQFKMAGGGDFKQPLVPGESGLPHPKNVLEMVLGCDNISSLTPVHDTHFDTAGNSNNITAQEPFNNISTPGLRVADLLQEDYIFTVNFLKPGELPFAGRFYHDVHYSPMQQVNYTKDNIDPTFFTLWLGFYDVFLYAQNGGTGSSNPIGTPLLTDITPIDLFKANYDSLVHTLVIGGAQGVLIGLPDILSMPYFTTVPIKDDNGVYFKTKDRAIVRDMVEGEMLLLEMPIDSLKCYGFGTTIPIPDKWALSAAEITNIRNAIAAFNKFIEEESVKYGLLYVDINSYLQTLNTGIKFNGVDYNPKFVEGGAYSLDGLHFSQRGCALVANHVLEKINARYGSTLPMIDANKYPGILFP